MTSRRRLQKVVVHREKALDESVQKLTAARAVQTRAEEERERARQEVERAAAERLKIAERVMAVDDWRAASEWLQSRQASHALRRKEVEQAEAEVEQSREGLLTARVALRSVELLDEKLGREERVAAERKEQRMEDEIASGQRLIRAAQKRGEP